DYRADPEHTQAVFLLGHIPVPYSGDLAPDGHVEHMGAWPADLYYGVLDGEWTDANVNDASASDPRNWNVPGDWKFDQSEPTSAVALHVGRVDFAHLPASALSEVELLRQYLRKDHNFRQGRLQAQPRGLIDDNFGLRDGEAFAANGWRNFSALLGA